MEATMFNEIYSLYYRTVEKLIKEAQGGTLNAEKTEEIAKAVAFEESFIYIADAISDESWQVINREFKTPIKNTPAMPLTLLEKRWLKAVSADPRVKLFVDGIEGLDDVEPLFAPDAFICVDSYKGGDDIGNPEYVRRFRTIMHALKHGNKLQITYRSRRDRLFCKEYIPLRLEYSEKENRFRLFVTGKRDYFVLNLGRMIEVNEAGKFSVDDVAVVEKKKAEVTFILVNERNALERTLLHFSGFEKETEKLSPRKYKITIKYTADDETEVLIRLLSYGPVIKVVAPESFVGLVKQRIFAQNSENID